MEPGVPTGGGAEGCQAYSRTHECLQACCTGYLLQQHAGPVWPPSTAQTLAPQAWAQWMPLSCVLQGVDVDAHLRLRLPQSPGWRHTRQCGQACRRRRSRWSSTAVPPLRHKLCTSGCWVAPGLCSSCGTLQVVAAQRGSMQRRALGGQGSQLECQCCVAGEGVRRAWC